MIFDMAINGKSLRFIAPWLDCEGVRTLSGKPWNEIYIGHLMKNTIYYGQRRNSGQLETEAVISYSVWQQGNAALNSRMKAGRSAVKSEKALMLPVCSNPDCDASGEHPSPMYRTGIRQGSKYRCYGTGPQRKGCGNGISVAELDARVIDSMESDHTNMHVDRVFIPGDDRSDEIGKLREKGAEAMKRGDYTAATDCMRQAEEMEALPRIAPHWEEVKSDQTESDYFMSLDMAGRRRELAENWIVSAHRASDGEIVLDIARKTLA
jgi:hypothetical protein